MGRVSFYETIPGEDGGEEYRRLWKMFNAILLDKGKSTNINGLFGVMLVDESFVICMTEKELVDDETTQGMIVHVDWRSGETKVVRYSVEYPRHVIIENAETFEVVADELIDWYYSGGVVNENIRN